MAVLRYLSISRHASVAYVSVQIGHPANFTNDRAQATFSEVCAECSRLLKEEGVTFLRISLFVYDFNIAATRLYTPLHEKMSFLKTFLGKDSFKVSCVFISRDSPSYSTLIMNRALGYCLGVDVCYAEPA